MKKVLIVSYYFPPLNNMAAKRFGIMCKYFEEYGYEVYILTSSPHAHSYMNTKLDLSIPLEKDKIIRIGRTGTVYDPSSVGFQGIVQFIDKKKWVSRTLSGMSLGWFEKVKQELNLSILKDINIIIGTYPSMENLLVANYLSHKLKCPYIADIRDLITEYSEDTGNMSRSFRLDAIVERLVLHNAVAIVPVTCGFKNILKKKYPNKPMKVIFNGWDKNECTKSVPSDKKYLYYAGSLYSHRLESFELLMQCLKKIVKVMDIKMIIRSVGPKNLDNNLKQMIKKAGMDKFIQLLEASEESVIREEQSRAYINVVLSSIHEDDEALMTTVPGKVYEVIHEKAPVLAIVPERSDVAQIINKTNKGIATISEEKIIDFILSKSNKYCGNKYVEFFSRKNQAKRYCMFLDEILENG